MAKNKFLNLLNTSRGIGTNLDRAIDEFQKIYSTQDVRVEVIELIRNLVKGYEFKLHLLSETQFITPVTEYYLMRNTPDEFKWIHKMGSTIDHSGFITLLHGTLESTMRMICNCVTGKLHKNVGDVRNDLQKWIGEDNHLDFFQGFRLLSEIRNLQHNNGRYRNYKQNYQPILYKGKRYDFTKKEIIEFVNMEFTLRLSMELIESFKDFLLDNKQREFPLIKNDLV